MTSHTNESPLGRHTAYIEKYSPDLLHPIPRSEGRDRLGITDALPFCGVDIWNAYELSWLNTKGKPVVATGELRFPATSPNIIESKSLKLYLNSLNNARYASPGAVRSILQTELSARAGATVDIELRPAPATVPSMRANLPGVNLDDLDLEISEYDLNPALLSGSVTRGVEISETVHSHLLRSNCPVTGQPDWASVLIRYRGRKLSHARLLAYLVSYRNHNEFHEHCVERMFVDIQRYCAPSALTVQALYARRGGLDINPFRSDVEAAPRRGGGR